jgi:aquaporin Z
MRKYATEFIGTFFLVFTVVTAVISGAALAPLAIGAVLAAMVFAGGHVSGGHFNPAVSLAVWFRGRLETREVPLYMVAQVLGGALAAGVGRFVVDKRPAAAFEVAGRQLAAAFVAELLVTFALAYVVVSVTTSKDHPNNSFYGLAIGFTVLAGAVAVGGISGGVFNPAVAVGVSLAGMVSWSIFWMYLLANLLGGLLAGAAFRALNPTDLAVESPPARAEPVASDGPTDFRGGSATDMPT